MTPIFSPSYYILRDRIPFFFTILYIYRHKLPDELINAWGWTLTAYAAIATGVSLGLHLMGQDMSFIAGIAWSAPSPIQWGSMTVVLTGLLWSRKTPIFEAFYLSTLTAIGGGWIYEFAPLLFHDNFNWLIFFKVNAVKVFFVEFQIFCLPIAAYLIATRKRYRSHILLLPSFLLLVAWSAYRPSIEQYVRDNLIYSYRWYIRLPAILFLSLWIYGVKGEKEPSPLLCKFRKYVSLIPERVKQYGVKTMFYKILADISLKLKMPIPKRTRWGWAHSFHTAWKNQQVNFYGAEEYNRRIDLKSSEVMNKFYEVGLDFTGKTFVDVGCCTRGVLPIIKAKRRIGIDPTIGKLVGFTFPSGIEYISEKAECMSLPRGSVDVVCCNNTLNHVQDPMAAVMEMYRILKPGGLLLLEVFIEKENVAHTVEFTEESLTNLVKSCFNLVHKKYERLTVEVDIEEEYDGYLPMRWGGVFKK